MSNHAFDSLLVVAGKALAMEAARLEVSRLTAERNGCLCEVAEPPEPDGVDPCWKTYDTPGAQPDDGPTRAPQEEWCEPCRLREAAHLARQAAMKRLLSARSGLARACAAFRRIPIETTTGHDRP